MKPMLPTLTFENPEGKEWVYEVKYDGFRSFLEWDTDLKLTSRNDKPLLDIFPEIEAFFQKHHDQFQPFLPMTLDGELVDLDNPYKADFGAIQIRGRMRAKAKIKTQAEKHPCRLIIFDILKLRGEDLSKKPYHERRQILEKLFKQLALQPFPDPLSSQLMQLVPQEAHFHSLWDLIQLYNGEGIVAKQRNSVWDEGKRSDKWLKLKNWKYVDCFVTAYEKANGYYYVSVFQNGKPHPIGNVLFGFKPDEKAALFEIIKNNHSQEDEQFLYVEPAICLEIKYLEIYENQMREPHFHQFRFHLKPEDCTYERFVQRQKNLPSDLEITHPDKPLWEKPPIQKINYIDYLREVSPYMLPFLKDRLLTVIRYPHGMYGEAFYQKNAPDYTPEFVKTAKADDINYILCNDLKTLLWLGNQIAIEYHIPFQTVDSTGPDEVVFDLDPPSKDHFYLAIEAALLIKEVLDQLELISFIKTSGSKGLQIYLPLPKHKYTYEDTKLFTSFIADYLVSKRPESFTTERLKKNRGNRLYVDYIQHAEGKTIIAPFSPRGKKEANVAAPLFWEEVNESLSIDSFKMSNIVERLKDQGSPFANYFEVKEIQAFDPVLKVLQQGK